MKTGGQERTFAVYRTIFGFGAGPSFNGYEVRFDEAEITDTLGSFGAQVLSTFQFPEGHVETMSWYVEGAPGEEQSIFADVKFSDGSTKRYHVDDEARGCAATDVSTPPELGRMRCYYAASGVDYVASYSQNGKFVVERHAESARDGSINKSVVLEI